MLRVALPQNGGHLFISRFENPVYSGFKKPVGSGFGGIVDVTSYKGIKDS